MQYEYFYIIYYCRLHITLFTPFSQVIMFQARHQKRLLTHYQQRVRDVYLATADVCWGVCVCPRGFAFLDLLGNGLYF